MSRVIAKKYFGNCDDIGFSWYRTDSGHTFVKSNSPYAPCVIYCGNVKKGEDLNVKLSEEEMDVLFSKVDFVNT